MGALKLKFFSRDSDSYHSLPGPNLPPYVGVALKLRKYGVEYLYQQHLTYGEFSQFPIPGIRGVLVTDPNFIKMALAQTERNFYKGRIYDLAKIVVGEGIVTSKGAKWKKNRNHMNPIFSPKNINRLDHSIQDIIQKSIGQLSSQLGEVINLSEFCSNLTFSIIAKTMFSMTDEGQYKKLAYNFKACLDYLSWYFWAVIPLPLSVPTKRNKTLVRAKSEIVNYIINLIETRQQGSKESDLLQRLIDAESGETRIRLTREEIIDETLTAMLAGYETTALTLSYCFYLLSKNPEWVKRIREEVTTQFGDDPIPAEGMKSLPITIAVLKETMRFYPSAFMINRSNRNRIDYKDYSFDADTTFFFPQYVVHRHEKYWDKPTQFCPERFLEGDINSAAYFPFGGGPRSCVGSHLALLEATLCLAEIAKRFDVSYVQQTFKLTPSATMVPEPDLRIRFVEPLNS